MTAPQTPVPQGQKGQKTYSQGEVVLLCTASLIGGAMLMGLVALQFFT